MVRPQAMVSERVSQRLRSLGVLPDMQAALTLAATKGWATEEEEEPHVFVAIETLYEALGGGEGSCIQTFQAAWAALKSTLTHLDHLQDDDPELPGTPFISVGASYNVVFASYVLASALLDDLDELGIAPARISRLRRLWSDSMLQA